MSRNCRRCDYVADHRDDLAVHARDARHPLCGCCGHSLCLDEPATCVRCVGAARRNLSTVVELVILAETDYVTGWPTSSGPKDGPRSNERPLPGGDLLVLLAPGSDGRSQIAGGLELGVAAHAEDEFPGDSQSVEQLLAGWEDDWRRIRKERAAYTSRRRVMTDAQRYLDRNVGWAAQNHPDFPTFASDLRTIRAELEQRLRAGPQRSPVPCLGCGARALERVPQRSDTDRDIETWQCGKCHRTYEDGEYWMAVRQDMEGAN